jgi:hypothetical protein
VTKKEEDCPYLKRGDVVVALLEISSVDSKVLLGLDSFMPPIAFRRPWKC